MGMERAVTIRCLIVASLLFPGAVAAQESDASRIQPGDSVRVTIKGALPIPGVLDSWRSEVMVLSIDGLDDTWGVSVSDMTALQVYTRRTNRESFRHGAMMGSVLGIFVGTALGAALNASGVTDDPEGPPAQIVTAALTGTAIGFLGGALLGGLYYGRRPGMGWIRITLPGG